MDRYIVCLWKIIHVTPLWLPSLPPTTTQPSRRDIRLMALIPVSQIFKPEDCHPTTEALSVLTLRRRAKEAGHIYSRIWPSMEEGQDRDTPDVIQRNIFWLLYSS